MRVYNWGAIHSRHRDVDGKENRVESRFFFYINNISCVLCFDPFSFAVIALTRRIPRHHDQSRYCTHVRQSFSSLWTTMVCAVQSHHIADGVQHFLHPACLPPLLPRPPFRPPDSSRKSVTRAWTCHRACIRVFFCLGNTMLSSTHVQPLSPAPSYFLGG